MVLRAAAYLVRHGPVTPQERWEEVSGYSPSTLASNIAALICAACFAREKKDRGDREIPGRIRRFPGMPCRELDGHNRRDPAARSGSALLADSSRAGRQPYPPEDPNQGSIAIANRPPGAQNVFPAKEVVDAGFLELVRHGIRRADDPIIVDSLKVVDAVLKVETPFGPCWRRYNHDGYGQREDGGPFVGWGRGRAWPLLTGERGHYELAAGHDTKPFIRAMEGLASPLAYCPSRRGMVRISPKSTCTWDDQRAPRCR